MTSAERARRALYELQGYERYSDSMVDQDEARLTADIDAAVAEARAELDATRAALATETANANAYAHERDEALDMLRGTVRTLTTTRSLLGADASETVIEAAQRVAEALPRWVPVGERLPGPDDLVLVSTANGDVCACMYCPSYDDDEPGRWTAGEWPIYDVVAWQPLPAAWVAR